MSKEKINDKYRIAASANSWNIEECRIPKTGDNVGKETWVAFKYYGTILQAAKSLLELLAAEGLKDGHSIPDLIKAIKEAEANVALIVAAIELPKRVIMPEKAIKTVHKAAREELVLTLTADEPKSSKAVKKRRK